MFPREKRGRHGPPLVLGHQGPPETLAWLWRCAITGGGQEQTGKCLDCLASPAGLPTWPGRILAWPHPSPELFFFLPASWASPRLPHSLCFCSAVCPDLSLCPAWPLVCVGVQDARQAPACRQTDPTLHDSACCMLKQIGVKSCFPPPLIIPLSAPKASSQLEKNVIFQVPSNFYDAKTPIQQLLYRSSLSTSQWKGSSFHVNPIFFGSSIYEVPEVFKCRRLLPPTHSGTKHGASRIY